MNKKKHISALFCLLLLFSFSSCASYYPDFAETPLSFVGSYTENGVEFTAAFTATEYGKTLTAEILTPPAAAGIVYREENDTVTVTRGTQERTLSSCPAPLLRLHLLFPKHPVLGSVMTENGKKTVTVYDDGYTLTYEFGGAELPERVTAEHGDTHISLTIGGVE